MATSVIFRNITNTYFDYRREIKKKKNRFKLSAYEKLNDDDWESENYIEDNIRNNIYNGNNNNNSPKNLSNRNIKQIGISHLNNDGDIEMQEDANLLPPFWIERIEECTEDINNIKTKLIELQKLQQKKLLNVLSNDEHISESISHMSTNLTFLIKNCEQKIQSISDEENNDKSCENYENQEINNGSPSNVIEKFKKNAKHSLASQLQSLSHMFHKKQKRYLKEYQKMCNDYGNITGYEKEKLNVDFNKNPYILENKNEYDIAGDQMFYEQVNEIMTTSDQDLNKRNSDLKKIADTVVDLHTIFKELSVMLVDQGTVLDQIDYNIDVTLDKSEHGLKKLKILQKRENDKRAKKCISFLTTLIFVLLILIIIKHVF